MCSGHSSKRYGRIVLSSATRECDDWLCKWNLLSIDSLFNESIISFQRGEEEEYEILNVLEFSRYVIDLPLLLFIPVLATLQWSKTDECHCSHAEKRDQTLLQRRREFDASRNHLRTTSEHSLLQDSIIMERVGSDNRNVQDTSAHLESFASDGLRTLCLAYRVLSTEEYEVSLEWRSSRVNALVYWILTGMASEIPSGIDHNPQAQWVSGSSSGWNRKESDSSRWNWNRRQTTRCK